MPHWNKQNGQPLKNVYEGLYSKTLQKNQNGITKSCSRNQQKERENRKNKRTKQKTVKWQTKALTYQELHYI